MIFRFTAALGLVLASASLTLAQSPEVGKRKHLIYHDIQTDRGGNIIPWYNPDPAVAYDHVLSLVWNYWKHVPNYWTNNPPEYRKLYGATAGVKKYFVFRTLDDPGVGGDQFAMALSSWSLYYAYTGDPAVLQDLRDEAGIYIANSLSPSTAVWPNLPYPCNTARFAIYDGDLVAGKGFTQPDKAGSFGAELVTLYKITGERKYLDVARNIAGTLAAKVQPGDDDHSPLPFRVNAETGEVRDAYTTNWTGTLRLFEALSALNEGDTARYGNAHRVLSDWLKRYPMKTNKWGPFFEDIVKFSDTEINAGTLAYYILEHPDWDPEWRADVRGIQDWVIQNLGLDYWKQYGLTVIAEQTAYRMQGQSHSSRHASVELEYAEKTGDTSRKAEAIRLLNWATYMVDDDGKNWYPNFEVYEIWWTDGYADYVRHYLRAMAAAPELAPPGQNHLLRTSSVCKHIEYQPRRVAYETFDESGNEVLRLAAKPKQIHGAVHSNWQPLANGGVLRVTRQGSSKVEIVL